MTYCACGHDESRHHPAGRCAVLLPEFLEEELPEWRCPCRRFVASGITTRLLASVPSCTVGAPPRVPDQRIRGPIIPGDAKVPAGRRWYR